MDDLRLRELGRQAVEAVTLPDLASLERRGRALRFRRQVGIVAAATLPAATGVWLLPDRTPHELRPAPPFEPEPGARPYPGAVMEDLEPGVYELTPSAVRTEPTALVTVPQGWNSWQGPNRFNGFDSGRTNEEALSESTWYAGLLVVKVLAVADSCAEPSTPDEFVETYRATVDAIKRLPGYRLVGAPVEDARFGHPATHLVMRLRAASADCGDFNGFATSANGEVGLDERTDVWVVDVDGTPITVIAGGTGAPMKIRAELEAMVDSIEFVVPE